MNRERTMVKRTRGNPIPLIVEQHPEDYDGYPFITLLQYRKEHILTLIDNTDDKIVKSYVLDLCGPSKVDEEKIVSIALQWWDNNRDRFPLSFEFSRQGVSEEASKIYRTFNVEYITRVIGPLPRYEMKETINIKRRKRKPLPKNAKVITNVVTFD